MGAIELGAAVRVSPLIKVSLKASDKWKECDVTQSGEKGGGERGLVAEFANIRLNLSFEEWNVS